MGGLEVNRINLAAIRESIAVVFQDTFLMDGTLEYNIRFGNPEVDELELSRVVQIAELESVLAKLPDGLGSRIGENGAKLSAGERQRVGLARALLRSPSLLILDEFTSALDNLTAAKILRDLRVYTRCTVIMITHRLANIADVDNIYVLANGRIMESGDFPELMAINGEFRRLYEAETALHL